MAKKTRSGRTRNEYNKQVEEITKIDVFKGNKVRKIIFHGEWWFSVIGVIRALTDCADTEGIFRIIQSIPSPKAEPFKRWLVKERDCVI